MSKFLLDFQDGVAVLFFELGGKTYTSATSSRYDLWDFLEKAPKTIQAKALAAEARQKARDIAFEQNIPLQEASAVLAAMSKGDVKYIADLTKKFNSNSNPGLSPNFDPRDLEF
jgi:hypothetical protein